MTPTELKPVHHPTLSVLYLYIVEITPFKMFLRLLAAPNLTSLAIKEVCFFPYGPPGFGEEYFSFMQRSEHPPIHRLNIQLSFIPMDISTLLIPAPTVTHLTFNCVSFNKEALRDMAEGRLGPNLQRLDVGGIQDVKVDEFLEMVLARNAHSKQAGKDGVMPFRRMSLYCSGISDQDVKALQEAGVECDDQ